MGGFGPGDGGGGNGGGGFPTLPPSGDWGSGISGATSSAIGAVEAWVSAGFGSLVKALGSLFNGIFGIFGRLRDFLRHLKDTLLGHLIGALWHDILKFRAWLHKVLDPVLETIRRIRKMQQFYFDHVLKPYLDLIQRLRRILVVFRVLHFKWATKLDADLQRMETRVAALFIDARRQLNVLADWINFILDPTGNIHHG